MSPPRPPVLPNLRQPLCPYCEYNLTGIYDRMASRAARCPECGEQIEAHELRWTLRKGDWTLMTGLRGAAVFLLMRGILASVVLVAAIFATEALGHLLQRIWPGFPLTLFMLILILLPAGIGCGKLLIRGFEDAAGFYGITLPLLATIALAVIGLALSIALPLIVTFAYAPAQGMIFMGCSVALVIIIIDYMSEAA